MGDDAVDFRWLGAAVGGAALGIAAGLEVRAACGNSERGTRSCTLPTLGAGVLGGLVGGMIGYFIGKTISW